MPGIGIEQGGEGREGRECYEMEWGGMGDRRGGTECNIQDPEGDMDIFRYI